LPYQFVFDGIIQGRHSPPNHRIFHSGTKGLEWVTIDFGMETLNVVGVHVYGRLDGYAYQVGNIKVMLRNGFTNTYTQGQMALAYQICLFYWGFDS
jgi:hypothetical protein